jgi:hypothetical protein
MGLPIMFKKVVRTLQSSSSASILVHIRQYAIQGFSFAIDAELTMRMHKGGKAITLLDSDNSMAHYSFTSSRLSQLLLKNPCHFPLSSTTPASSTLSLSSFIPITASHDPARGHLLRMHLVSKKWRASTFSKSPNLKPVIFSSSHTYCHRH